MRRQLDVGNAQAGKTGDTKAGGGNLQPVLAVDKAWRDGRAEAGEAGWRYSGYRHGLWARV